MSACHVNVENDVTFVLPLTNVVIGHADRQGSLFAVVHRCITKRKCYALITNATGAIKVQVKFSSTSSLRTVRASPLLAAWQRWQSTSTRRPPTLSNPPPVCGLLPRRSRCFCNEITLYLPEEGGIFTNIYVYIFLYRSLIALYRESKFDPRRSRLFIHSYCTAVT